MELCDVDTLHFESSHQLRSGSFQMRQTNIRRGENLTSLETTERDKKKVLGLNLSGYLSLYLSLSFLFDF